MDSESKSKTIVTIDFSEMAEAFQIEVPDGSDSELGAAAREDALEIAMESMRGALEGAGFAVQGISVAEGPRLSLGRAKVTGMRSRRRRRIGGPMPFHEVKPVWPGGAPEASSSVIEGSGLGAIVDDEEGWRRLRKGAASGPMQEWAGEVLGPKYAAERVGVSRSTIDNWRSSGEIIALPKGKASHRIPMEQFVDGRPPKGIRDVIEAARGNGAVAWQWLRLPHIDFEGHAPIEALHEGHAAEVIAVARRDLA